jgi:hypothetical protein
MGGAFPILSYEKIPYASKRVTPLMRGFDLDAPKANGY